MNLLPLKVVHIDFRYLFAWKRVDEIWELCLTGLRLSIKEAGCFFQCS